MRAPIVLLTSAPVLLFLLMLLCPWPSHGSLLEHGQWGYNETNGPRMWPQAFKQFCTGRKQSPIDLALTGSVHDPSLTEYVIRMEETPEFSLKLENDGHKAQIIIGTNLVIKKGLGNTMYYTAEQLHWHWGADNTRGSEHTIAGKPYPMESHLVFWNSYDYANFSTAVHGVGGLAVLGVFYELSETDNPLIKAMEPYLPLLVNSSSKTDATFKATELNFLDAFLPKSTRHFYRYEGSLTTPKCNENVLWTVYTEPVPISARQLALMRALRYPNGKPCVDNFRPVQPLNPIGRPGANRVVYRTFDRKGLVVGDSRYRGSTRGAPASLTVGPAATVVAVALGCWLRLWTAAY